MSRCDYDGVFYRVFCVTLLATAFTFTVILTNVFIDIDGLLSKRNKQSHEAEINGNDATTIGPYEKTEESINDRNDVEDRSDAFYRTKRSLDTPDFVTYMKKHKMKKMLKSRLAKLLQHLDEQDDYNIRIVNKLGYFDNRQKTMEDESLEIITEIDHSNEHSTDKIEQSANMQNMLQNIIGHIYLKDNIKRFKAVDTNNYQNNTLSEETNVVTGDTSIKTTSNSGVTDEKKTVSLSAQTKQRIEYPKNNNTQDLSKMGKSARLKEDEKENDFATHDSKISTISKLIEWDKQQKKLENFQSKFKGAEKSEKEETSFGFIKPFINDSIPHIVSLTGPNEVNSTNRSKRHIKVRHDDSEQQAPKLKPIRNKLKKTDDELYVEIETHFDGKGVKGEKKKKLVKNLIDRIQKAIRADTDSQGDENHVQKMKQHLQIKKRTQDPLKIKHEKTLNKYTLNFNSIEHRQLNPINDKLPMHDLSTNLEDHLEERYGNYPNSHTLSNLDKSIEIGNTDTEINNVLNSGVPQRFQVPLNSNDMKEIANKQNSYADTGNVTLFIKDIDGSGFSVGFNQYMDEPPDVESMKIFSGIENVIKSYHENYDQNAAGNDIDNSSEKQHELTKRNIHNNQNEHVLLRRSVRELNKEDYHSNAYKILFNKKVLPYKSYQDILQVPNKRAVSSNYEYKVRNYNFNPKNIKIVTKDIKIKALPLVLDDNIFEKKLKPSEIFSLASLLLDNQNRRKKRSVNVQKITNLKSRIKLNRYINTKAMQSKKVFQKNKRNKREINKIRIVASDHLHNNPKNSDENIFVVSGEKLFTNRAVLREIELPESDTGDERGDEQGEDMIPAFEESNSEASFPTNLFKTKYRHNSLMSKYPHIFTDRITNSKESQFINNNEYYVSEGNPSRRLENLLGMQAAAEKIASSEKDVPDIVDAILPTPSKSNYKVTVKILPKNLTGSPSGFKEMHTIINKTYNNNGVHYYTLVNVTEISKIEKINKTNEVVIEPSQNIITDNTQGHNNKVKLLLTLQREKIEQQLQNLNKERDNLDTILRDGDRIKERNFNDILKDFIHVETPKNDLTFTSDTYTTPVVIKNIIEVVTTTPAAIVTTQNVKALKTPELIPQIDKGNKKLETSIKENENFNNEILSRINKNTDILQSFLQKLVDKLNPLSLVSTTTQQSNIEHVAEDSKHFKAHSDLSKDWGSHLNNMHDTFFSDHAPHKNDSHYAIPFVYAYQHPYLSSNKQAVPMAKVVYHGHIHTSAIHKHTSDNWKLPDSNPILTQNANGAKHDNSTKFFIDSIPRDLSPVVPKIMENIDFNHNCSTSKNSR